MAHKRAVEAVDRTLRDIRNSQLPFGGITVVFSGDFRQTLPVVERGTRADEVDACLQKSQLWHIIHRLRLTQNMRVALGGGAEMASFASTLLHIGNGTRPTIKHDDIRIDDICHLTNIDGLINAVYPDINQNIRSDHCSSWLCERAILAPKNEETAAINFHVQGLVIGEEKTYLASNKTVNEDESVLYPSEYLATVTASGTTSLLSINHMTALSPFHINAYIIVYINKHSRSSALYTDSQSGIPHNSDEEP